MKLTQKETTLLKDLKQGEKLCIKRYEKSSKEACSEPLKKLFTKLSLKETEHLNTINNIIKGKVPEVPAKKKSALKPKYDVSYNTKEKTQDAFLCEDSLSAEKHISSLYNTCIFEFTDVNLRNILNHIQKEEQEHGESLYDYMNQCGMYA
ncbi:MAG: spore coat protein [Clostridia bacterium]